MLRTIFQREETMLRGQADVWSPSLPRKRQPFQAFAPWPKNTSGPTNAVDFVVTGSPRTFRLPRSRRVEIPVLANTPTAIRRLLLQNLLVSVTVTLSIAAGLAVLTRSVTPALRADSDDSTNLIVHHRYSSWAFFGGTEARWFSHWHLNQARPA